MLEKTGKALYNRFGLLESKQVSYHRLNRWFESDAASPARPGDGFRFQADQTGCLFFPCNSVPEQRLDRNRL